METYYLGAYWQPRQESLNDCVRRIQELLICAGGCDPCFRYWYRLGRSKAQALSNVVSSDLTSIQSLVMKGVHHSADGNTIEELGYHVGMWNGAESDDEATNLSITCGCFSPSAKNSCVISLPAKGDAAERILRYPKLRMLVQCTVQAFEPDWCVVMSRSYRDSLSTWSADEPRAGWLLYISHRFGRLPTFRWNVQTDNVNAPGMLLIATTEQFSVSNATHVQAAEVIDQMLREGGLLNG